MSLSSGENEPIVHVQTESVDLYNLSFVQLANGGSIHGFGMGVPFLELLGENKADKIGGGVIASVTAVPIPGLSSESQQLDSTSSLDFITPQGVVGLGLATMALSRRMERSIERGHTEHNVPTWRRVQDLSLSVIALDTDVRRTAHKNPYFTPDQDTNIEIIPPFIPKDPDSTVDVSLYVNKDNVLETTPTHNSVEVGTIKFAKREQAASQVIPLDEVFRRADWQVNSAPYSGYFLRIMTGSRVQKIDVAQELPDNVRQIANGYGLNG